jgi:DNA-binding Xre family transcriptional regulator
VVRIKIREIAEKRGINNPFQLMKLTGLNYAQCHLYWNSQPKQIGVDALNRLCMGLEVTPGEIFEFETDSNWSSDGLIRKSKRSKRKAK